MMRKQRVIPKSLITPEMLSSKNNDSRTAKDFHVIFLDDDKTSQLSSIPSKKKLSKLPVNFVPQSREELQNYTFHCLREYAKVNQLLDPEKKKYKKDEVEELIWLHFDDKHDRI